MKSKDSSLAPRSSRRSLLKGSVAGVAGLAAVGGVATAGAILTHSNDANAAHAADANSSRSAANAIAAILNIAITAEELGVIFYTQALIHSGQLGFSPAGFLDIQAALIEEQIHQVFLAQHGAKALTNKFSFPFGQNTFRRFDLFLKVQQQLEALFIAAYLAAGKEFAMLGRPDLVQAAAQIGGVEAEHRAIGRAIGGLRPANNRAFETVLIKSVAMAPAALKQGGFLNPQPGNSFTFTPYNRRMDGMSGLSLSSGDWS